MPDHSAPAPERWSALITGRDQTLSAFIPRASPTPIPAMNASPPPRFDSPPHLSVVATHPPPLPSDQSCESAESIEFILDPEDRDPEPYWLTGVSAPATPGYAGNSSTRSSFSAASGATEMPGGGGAGGALAGGVERALDAYWAPAGVASPLPIVRRNSTPNCTSHGSGGLSVSDGIVRNRRHDSGGAVGVGTGMGVPRMLGGRLVPGLNRVEQTIADTFTQDIQDFGFPNSHHALAHARLAAQLPEIPPYTPKRQPHSLAATGPNSPHNRHTRDRRGSAASLAQSQYAALKASHSHFDHSHAHALAHSRQDLANQHSIDQLQHSLANLLGTVHAIQSEQATHYRQWDTALYKMEKQLIVSKAEASQWKERALQTEHYVVELEARVHALEAREAGVVLAEKQAIRDRMIMKLGKLRLFILSKYLIGHTDKPCP